MRLFSQTANNKALAYGKISTYHNDVNKGTYLVGFTNDGLVVEYCFMENQAEKIKEENERLQSLGYTTKVTGRKYLKINVIL